jgi:hypothetical protein
VSDNLPPTGLTPWTDPIVETPPSDRDLAYARMANHITNVLRDTMGPYIGKIGNANLREELAHGLKITLHMAATTQKVKVRESEDGAGIEIAVYDPTVNRGVANLDGAKMTPEAESWWQDYGMEPCATCKHGRQSHDLDVMQEMLIDGRCFQCPCEKFSGSPIPSFA